MPAFILGARECFDRSGYVGTRIEDIAAAANYAVGSFYTYFASKEEVLLAASRSAEEALSPVETTTSVPGSAHLANVVDGVVAGCFARSGLDAAMEQAALRSPTVLVEWRLGRARAVGSVADALRRAQLADALSDDELASVASALLSMSEQSGRVASDVNDEAMQRVWRASLDPELVEATPLTGSVDRSSEPLSGPVATGSRDRLLAAAHRLFTAEAWDSVSVARIAEAAGMANGTFYRHFSSKSDVLAALVDGPSAPLFPPASKGVSLSFADEVFHLVISHFDRVRQRAGLWSTVAEASGADPRVRDAVALVRRRWVSSVDDAVRDWQRSGEVAPGVNVAAVVPLLAAMLEREAFLVTVVSLQAGSLYESAATIRDCWWRALTAE